MGARGGDLLCQARIHWKLLGRDGHSQIPLQKDSDAGWKQEEGRYHWNQGEDSLKVGCSAWCREDEKAQEFVPSTVPGTHKNCCSYWVTSLKSVALVTKKMCGWFDEEQLQEDGRSREKNTVSCAMSVWKGVEAWNNRQVRAWAQRLTCRHPWGFLSRYKDATSYAQPSLTKKKKKIKDGNVFVFCGCRWCGLWMAVLGVVPHSNLEPKAHYPPTPT